MANILDRRSIRLLLAAPALAGVVVATALLLSGHARFPAAYLRSQTSRAPELVGHLCDPTAEPLACPRAPSVRDATRRGDAVAWAYVGLGGVAIWCLAALRTWSPTCGHAGRAGFTAVACLTAGGISDLRENALLRESAGRLAHGGFPTYEAAQGALAHLAGQTVVWETAKWAFLAAALVVVLWTLFGPPQVRARPYPVYNRPPRDPERPWDPPKGPPGRMGICCSGGGIRSAAFSLGALQAFWDHPGGDPLLPRATYLSAVSGGGYLAAGLAVAQATTKNHKPPVFSQGSPEERHFRDNSSYLVPDLGRGATGVGRLLLGLVLNLLIVWLVLFVLARPVGWAIGELHPELRAHTPVALTRDPIPELHVVDVTEVGCTQAPVCDSPTGVRAATVFFDVDLLDQDVPPTDERVKERAKDQETAAVLLDLAPFDLADDKAECSVFVTDERAPGGPEPIEREGRSRIEAQRARARHALVAVTGTKAEVVRQPVVEPYLPAGQPGRCAPLGPTLAVDRQPELSLRSSAVGPVPEDIRAELVVSTQPRVTSATGLRGRHHVTIPNWMWVDVCAAAGVAGLFGLLLIVLRPSGTWALPRSRRLVAKLSEERHPAIRRSLRRLGVRRTVLVVPALAATVATVAMFLLFVALPWLIQEVPAWLTAGSGVLDHAVGAAGGGLQDYLVPGGGFLFLAVTALRRYLAGAPDTDDGRRSVRTGGPIKRVWGWLTGRSKQLSWYELSPAKVLLGILLAVSGVVIFVLHLQYASANGPGGRLMGLAFIRDKLQYRWWLPEWQRYLLVVGALVFFERFVDAHAWSLQPFYKRRLSCAFLEGRRQQRTGYDDRPLSFHEVLRPGAMHDFPQLVIGCAVNLSEVGRVPPGRRAASFTFSSTEIGGPLVGYVPADTYWETMRAARRKDITVPGAMAISGAAFSPAMGKFNLGPVGAIMALANLRLGVWLPHPEYVEGSFRNSWLHRPGWSWFLRELMNRYRFDSPYVYVSDGGHWENLGLVELLRRGCTEIVCINAGGDSQLSFGTIGEAIALAREELDVEFFDLDPSPLRPPIKASEEGRLLRRAENREEAEPLAVASYVRGRFRYPPNRGSREGLIWLIEPALTADLPFDVHVFAESEAIFPDDSTADQVFNHRQFEAFRALGHHQACKVAADPFFAGGAAGTPPVA